MSKTTRKRTYVLVECAVAIALSTVLSLLKIWQMPLGGSVTLLSMLPVIFVSIRHGMKWGLPTAFIYSLGQFFLGGALSWGLDGMTLFVCIAVDYLLAYTVLGFAGAFGKKDTGIICGTVASMLLRFLCHFITGVTIWERLKPWEIFGHTFENAPALYSLAYNGMYMLPEIIATTVAVLILIKIPVIKRYLKD